MSDERSIFKKWGPGWIYGGVLNAKQLSDELSEDLDISPWLPTMGHSMARSSSYSQIGSSVPSCSDCTSADPIPVTSMVSSIMTLTKTILGSGMLGLPYLCHVNGIGLFSAMLLIFSVLNAYTMYLLVWATDLTQVSPREFAEMDFGFLGQLAFGDIGLWVVQFIIGVDLWGTLVAYMVVIADIIQPAMALLVEGSAMEWLSLRVSIIALTALLVFPLCTWKGIDALSSAAVIGLSALACFVAFLLFRCATTDFEHHLQRAAMLHWGMGMVQTLPILAFVYNAHFNVFSIYNSMETRSSSRMGIVILAACMVSTVANVLVGASGDILFAGDVKANVLQNLNLQDVVASLVRAIFGVALVMTYPVLAFELRQMTELLLVGQRGGKWSRLSVAATLVISSSVIAIAVPSITVAFGLVGGTTTTAMSFILPPAFFLKIYHSSGSTSSKCRWFSVIPAWVVLIMGIVAIPLFTYLTLQEAGLF